MTYDIYGSDKRIAFATQAAGLNDWVDPVDVFFVSKIEEGLNGSGLLSASERAFLFMDATDPLTGTAFPKNDATKLHDKCICALTRSYKTDTSEKNKKAALYWNSCNEWQYANSKCMVSGIVQNWYLSEGGSLEKKSGRPPRQPRLEREIL